MTAQEVKEQLLAEGWKFIPIGGRTLREKRIECVDLILIAHPIGSEKQNRLIPDEGTEARKFWDSEMER